MKYRQATNNLISFVCCVKFTTRSFHNRLQTNMAEKLLIYTAENRTAVLQSHQITQNRLKKDIKLVKNWFRTQTHLPEIPDNKRIENVLIWCKFRIEKVKMVFDSYYTYRTKNPEFFDAMPNSPQIQKAMNTMHAVPLEKLTPDLYRVIIFKLNDSDVKNFELLDVIMVAYQKLEIILENDCSLGVVLVVDINEMSIQHIRKLHFLIIKNALLILQNAYCGRVQKMIFVNGSIIIKGLIAMIKLVVPKIGQRISVDTGTDSILKLFPKVIVPSDYGGDKKSLAEMNEDWRRLLSDWNPWFESRQHLKVDENVRNKG